VVVVVMVVVEEVVVWFSTRWELGATGSWELGAGSALGAGAGALGALGAGGGGGGGGWPAGRGLAADRGPRRRASPMSPCALQQKRRAVLAHNANAL
jgi:hypothetical protein